MKKSILAVSVIGFIFLHGCVSPQQRRQDFVDEHPTLSRDISTAILEGKIIKGMNRDDVRASWGEPKQITISASDSSATELWSYETPVGQFTEGVVILTISGGKLLNLVN